jgi:hypothetical protein
MTPRTQVVGASAVQAHVQVVNLVDGGHQRPDVRWRVQPQRTRGQLPPRCGAGAGAAAAAAAAHLAPGCQLREHLFDRNSDHKHSKHQTQGRECTCICHVLRVSYPRPVQCTVGSYAGWQWQARRLTPWSGNRGPHLVQHGAAPAEADQLDRQRLGAEGPARWRRRSAVSSCWVAARLPTA